MFLKKLWWIIINLILLITAISSFSLAKLLTIEPSESYSTLHPVDMVWDPTHQKIIIISNTESESGEPHALLWYFSKDGLPIQEKIITQPGIGFIMKGQYLNKGQLILISRIKARNNKNQLTDTKVSILTTNQENYFNTITTLKDLDLSFNNDLFIDEEGEKITILGGTHSFPLNDNNNRDDWDIFLHCITSNGDRVWTSIIGNPEDDVLGQVVGLNQFSYIVHSTWVPGKKWNIQLTILNELGKMISQKTILAGKGSDLVNKMIKVDNSHVILVGTTDSDESYLGIARGNTDLFIMKCDIEGNINWFRRFGGKYNDIGTNILLDTNGIIWVSGMTESKDGDIVGNQGGWDIWVLQFNKNGDLLQSRCYGTPNNEQPINMVQAEDDIWLLGMTQVTDTKSQPLLILLND